MRKNFSPGRKQESTPPSTESLFTGAKTPEYAIFYNIAYWWMSDFLKSLYHPHRKNTEKDDSSDDYSKYILQFKQEVSKQELPPAAYLKLRDYLWKGYLFAKNPSDLEVSEKDRRLIYKTINKLSDVRNFHSHYWHDNSNLEFDQELCDWINYLHQYALDQLQKENPKEVEEYKRKRKSESLFDRHNGKHYISQDGRNFFLSLFLKKGEMSRFMQQRKGCKRNDKPEFKLKHLLYRYYTHRDGATKNRYSIETSAFAELDEGTQTEILHARQLYKMVSYLRDVPGEMIDRTLFPFYYRGEEIDTAKQMLGFISEHKLLPKCEFGLLEDKSGKTIQKVIAFTYRESNYSFKIKIGALHKLLLDVIRDPQKETDCYECLSTFSRFREEFPEKLHDFTEGNGFAEEMEEYYTFKLKANDYTRGKLWNIIDSVNNNKKVNYKDKKELSDLALQKPIELSYHNFYFAKDQKPRRENQFMAFAARFLMDWNCTPQWEWLMEKFEPEEVACKAENSSKQVVKRVKRYAGHIPGGYRLSMKNQQVLVRLKKQPDLLFSIGETTMRNLVLAQLEGKPIEKVLERLCTDLNKIKQAGACNEALAYDDLKLLCGKTMPRYLKLMMRNESAVNMETLGHATSKAKERITRLVAYFEEIRCGKEVLNRKQINTQLIRCYKFFDWKYNNNNKEYKFLRQNEYQLMSIYHYTLAKEKLSKGYVSKLRNKLFADIQQHLPEKLDRIFKEHTSLDDLFEAVLKESIKLLTSWHNRLAGMNPNLKKACLSKLGIKVPAVPVPEQAIKTNLQQMKHLPLMVHPALVMKAFRYPQESNIFAQFRDDDKNSKGLLTDSYNYQNYLARFYTEGDKWKKLSHKLIGKVNVLKTLDTLIWKMARVYLDRNSSHIMKNLSALLMNETHSAFRLNQLHNAPIPVYQSEAGVEKPFKVVVQFKQLGDYMLITGKPLKKLAMQLFRRYPGDESLLAAGVQINNGYYHIDYSLIKQEMDRVYHESVMLSDFILQWEQTVVSNIPQTEKDKLIETAQADGKKAFINFRQVCQEACLPKADEDLLCTLRNHCLHAKIPEGFTYKERLNDDRIKKMLNITEEMMKKHEKKNAFYEALASLTNT